jgi:hypothetical protein
MFPLKGGIAIILDITVKELQLAQKNQVSGAALLFDSVNLCALTESDSLRMRGTRSQLRCSMPAVKKRVTSPQYERGEVFNAPIDPLIKPYSLFKTCASAKPHWTRMAGHFTPRLETR